MFTELAVNTDPLAATAKQIPKKIRSPMPIRNPGIMIGNVNSSRPVPANLLPDLEQESPARPVLPVEG